MTYRVTATVWLALAVILTVAASSSATTVPDRPQYTVTASADEDPALAVPVSPSPTGSSGVTAAPSTPAPSSVTLAPITAYRDQGAVDSGALVLWRQLPYLLSGHEHMGWGWLDDIPVGARVVVTTGPATGEYTVVGHHWMDVQGGEMPAYFAEFDLVLQTCTATGTGFTLAARHE